MSVQLSYDHLLQAKAELARRHLADFTAFTKEDYRFNWHHRVICEHLDNFAFGRCKNLLMFAPPQHGKSELATRRLVAFMLGLNPKLRIAVVSYNKEFAQAFNRDIQRIIDSAEYKLLFPDTYLAKSNVVTDVRSAYVRNMTMFETVGHKGSVRTVGVDGGLTGFPVDIVVFDDLYKSRADALSPKRRAMIESFFDSVLVPRLHNNSQILGLFTRWSKDDIGGMLTRRSNKWEVIEIPAIREKQHTAKWDPRKIGEALWPDHLSLDRLLEIKKDNPVVFNAMYQQTPKPSEDILIYNNWDVCEELPGNYPVFYGVDFGFSNDPTVILKMEYHKNHLWIDEVLFKSKQTNAMLKAEFEAAGLLRKYGWADSEDPKTINELNILGVAGMLKAEKGPGSLRRGILKCQELKIHVTRRSLNVKSELENYQFIVVGGKPTNDPLENGNDHAMDAMRYGVVGYLNRSGIKV